MHKLPQMLPTLTKHRRLRVEILPQSEQFCASTACDISNVCHVLATTALLYILILFIKPTN